MTVHNSSYVLYNIIFSELGIAVISSPGYIVHYVRHQNSIYLLCKIIGILLSISKSRPAMKCRSSEDFSTNIYSTQYVHTAKRTLKYVCTILI
jgi:hypothetical protein